MASTEIKRQQDARSTEQWVVAVSLATIAFLIGYEPFGELNNVAVLCFPPMVSLFAKWVGREALSSSRVYLIYFLIGIGRLALEANQLGTILAQQDSSDSLTAIQHLTGRVPGLVSGLLLPLVCGVSYYVMFGTQHSEESTTNSSDAFECLAKWIEQSDAPQQVQEWIVVMAERLASVDSQYKSLSTQIKKASQQTTEFSRASKQSAETIRQLSHASEQVTQALSHFQSELVGTRGEMRQIETAVTEIGSVVDQFAEIASNKILQHPLSTFK